MNPVSLAEFFEAAAAGVAAARLIRLGLAKQQPALLIFLLFMAVDLFGLSCLAPESAAYFWFFMVSLIVSWFVSIIVVREMFTLTLERYPGIRTAGYWSIYWAVGLSLTICLLITVYSGNGGARGRSGLYYVEIADQWFVQTLAVVVAAIMLFLSRYPLHLNRNTYVSCSFFSAVFLSDAAVLLVDAYAPHLFLRSVDTMQILFAGACFAAWAVMLKAAETDAPTRITFESPEEHHLLLQLESLNNLLARSGRR
jgi:hypothetical protein